MTLVERVSKIFYRDVACQSCPHRHEWHEPQPFGASYAHEILVRCRLLDGPIDRLADCPGLSADDLGCDSIDDERVARSEASSGPSTPRPPLDLSPAAQETKA